MKSLEQRLHEIIQIRKKLKDLGIDQLDGMKDFHYVCNEYVKKGISLSGKIKLPDTGRRLDYIFPMKDEIKCNITLKKVY